MQKNTKHESLDNLTPADVYFNRVQAPGHIDQARTCGIDTT